MTYAIGQKVLECPSNFHLRLEHRGVMSRNRRLRNVRPGSAEPIFSSIKVELTEAFHGASKMTI